MNNEELHNRSTCSDLNFSDHWSDATVQREISRGAILRHQKQRNYLDSLNHNYDEPSTSKSNQMHQVFRKSAYIKPRKTKRRNPSKRCPIRIAELAVPTKRHCIDTWRTKARVIPIFMVERLKQRVMDEKPIVLIADAVNCFGRRKTKRKRKIKKPLSGAENTRMRHFKLLSAIFGYKIALILRRPMSLSLNSGLERINNVVKGEIDAMLRQKNSYRQQEVRNKEFLEEFSRKVTVWIDTILEESDCKLLEENLHELEEEEGPVLDLIDDLVDEVLIICNPPSLVNASEIISEIDLLSVLSKDSTKEIFANITEVNIPQLMTDVYTDALENAERQILEKHNDSLLPKEVSTIQQQILSIGNDSKHVIEDVRGELDKQIISDLITADSQIQDEKYSTDNDEESMQMLTQFHENNDDSLQIPKVLLIQQHNINVNEDASVPEDSKKPVDDLEYKYDTDINDIKNETNENTEIVNDIINDFLKTGVWNSEPNVMTIDDVNISKVADTEALLNQDSLETENKFINVTKNLQNELISYNETNQEEADNITKFEDIENEDLSPKSKETDQIVEDMLTTVFETLADKSSHNGIEAIEDNKKVKFSAIDMGIGVNKILLTKPSGQELILQTPSYDYLKLNIDFAPPNENLLSNVDESWPQNISLPILKVTESVNKSVTSLGKIFEIDEKGISSESSYVSIQNSEMLIDVQLTSMSLDNSKMNELLLAPFQNENEIVVENEETNKIENEKSQSIEIDKKKQVKNKRKNKNETKHDFKPRVINKNKSKDINGIILNKPNEHQKRTCNVAENPKKYNRMLQNDKIDRIKVSVNRRDVAKNKINENRTGIKQKKPITPEIDVKKPEIITNTPDVISKEDRGDGLKNEPKQEAYSCEKYFSTEQKTKLKQNGKINIDAYDVLKWCKGLENVIENLETWTAWMNSTCKCITYLKQKGNYYSSRSVEKTKIKWKMLHRNIKQDRILWRDMKQRNRDGLKSYKKYYHDIRNGATKFQMCDCGKN